MPRPAYRIHTLFAPLPVADRGYDWYAEAILDEPEIEGSGMPAGWGATRQEAIADLVTQIEEGF